MAGLDWRRFDAGAQQTWAGARAWQHCSAVTVAPCAIGTTAPLSLRWALAGAASHRPMVTPPAYARRHVSTAPALRRVTSSGASCHSLVGRHQFHGHRVRQPRAILAGTSAFQPARAHSSWLRLPKGVHDLVSRIGRDIAERGTGGSSSASAGSNGGTAEPRHSRARGIDGAADKPNAQGPSEPAASRLSSAKRWLTAAAKDTLASAKDKLPAKTLERASSAARSATSVAASALGGAATDAVNNAVSQLDPVRHARRTRNWFIAVFLGGVFLYGVGTAVPGAIKDYRLEQNRARREAPPALTSSSGGSSSSAEAQAASSWSSWFSFGGSKSTTKAPAPGERALSDEPTLADSAGRWLRDVTGTGGETDS